jgi:hypothetical protein
MSVVVGRFIGMSSAVADYRHPAVEAVAAIDAALTELAEAPLWSMPAADVARLVVAVERIDRRLEAAKVELLAQADRSDVAAQTGASSTVAWLRDVADVPVRVGRARLALHRELANRAITASAFSAGDIGLDAATAVCAAIEALPGDVPAALNDEIEQLLVDTAREEGTKAVVQRGMEISHRFDPDGLEFQEQIAKTRRWLTLTQNHDGTVGLRGMLDKESGALALAVLSPLAAPAPVTDGISDMRFPGQRYADAFVQLCQLATPALPDVRGERPHVFVTTTLESLQNKIGCALGTLDGRYHLSPGALRRVACDANIIPVVLGTNGQPLDIGRATRIVPVAMRRALVARDQGCAFPGCDRPPSWCDAHHCKHWANGGRTAICNLCLLCVHHHDVVHRDGWNIEMIDGFPWFIPPPWLDSTQAPRQNSRFRVRALDP